MGWSNSELCYRILQISYYVVFFLIRAKLKKGLDLHLQAEHCFKKSRTKTPASVFDFSKQFVKITQCSASASFIDQC